MRNDLRVVFIHLCGPLIDGWTYRENLLTKYLGEFSSVSIISNYEGFKENSNRIEYLGESQHKISFDTSRLNHNKFIPYFLNSKFRIYTGLFEKLVNLNPDMIYVNSLQFFSLLDVIRYKKKYPSTKIIAELNATFLNSGRTWLSRNFLHGFYYQFIINRALLKIDKLYYGSSAARTFSVTLYRISDQHEILPLGVNDEKISQILLKDRNVLRKNLGIKHSDFVICTGGKLDSRKNLLQLVKAINQLKNLNLKLLIFGSLVNLGNEVSNIIDTSDNISFMGWLKEDDIYEVFRSSDLAVFPGTKSALWESAIATGLPLIAQYWIGNEYIDFGGNIDYLYLNGDINEICKNIYDLYNNVNKLKLMSLLALENGLSQLSYRKIANKIIVDYHELKE